MSEIAIRAVESLADVRQLVRLYGQVWPGSFGIIDLLTSTADCLVLAKGPFSVIGYTFVEPDLQRGFAELQDIAVDPEHQGRGLGTRLLAAVMARYPAIKLMAEAGKPELTRFYERAGFRTEQVVENYYEVGRDGLRMAWRRAQRA
jgi:ribosomal protein S18 acetylase RimI-like enzyme